MDMQIRSNKAAQGRAALTRLSFSQLLRQARSNAARAFIQRLFPVRFVTASANYTRPATPHSNSIRQRAASHALLIMRD